MALEADGRGKHHNRPNKISNHIVTTVKNHIDSFPRVESHYCRSSTDREYLESSLNICKLYRLYLEWMKEKDDNAIVTQSRYALIFNTEFNIFFQRPKKDLCDDCEAYKNTPANEQSLLLDNYKCHLSKKNLARTWMKNDILEANTNKLICTASFDLQQVLNVPKAEVSVMYYKRKLSIYNLTVYDLASHEGECNVWDETISKRGANEVSSCIYKYIEKKIKTEATDFRFYSDNCSGQNRNRIIFTMYLIAAAQFNVTITHRFLVKGHSQTSGDSMHSVIEKASRSINIYTMEEWCSVMKQAKVEDPVYIVNKMEQADFMDFDSIANKNLWKKIPIPKISELRVAPSKNVVYKVNYTDSEIVSPVKPYTSKLNLKQCFGAKIPLSSEKKRSTIFTGSSLYSR